MMELKEWKEAAEDGTSGDMVHNILSDWMKEKEKLEAELETERLRLAACGTAALGYFTDCKPEYRSASLEDVLALYATVTRQREFIEKYAFHQPDCPVLRYTSTVQVHECQCGYTQGMKALKEAP